MENIKNLYISAKATPLLLAGTATLIYLNFKRKKYYRIPNPAKEDPEIIIKKYKEQIERNHKDLEEKYNELENKMDDLMETIEDDSKIIEGYQYTKK